MIERKKAPPIPYQVSVIPWRLRDDPNAPGHDIRPFIDDWRLEIDFHRPIVASLWLELKSDFGLDPLRDLIHLTGGDATSVDITLKAVLPVRTNDKWEIAFYEVGGWERANTITQQDMST